MVRTGLLTKAKTGGGRAGSAGGNKGGVARKVLCAESSTVGIDVETGVLVTGAETKEYTARRVLGEAQAGMVARTGIRLGLGARTRTQI